MSGIRMSGIQMVTVPICYEFNYLRDNFKTEIFVPDDIFCAEQDPASRHQSHQRGRG